MGETPESLYAWGTSLRRSDDVTDASLRAHRLLSMAGLQNYVPAQVDLGIMHRDGDGCAKNRIRALTWFYVAAKENERAANQAQALAGQLSAREIREAIRLSQDFPRAQALFQSARDDSDPVAMTALGQLYADGDVLERDVVLAAKWFMRALTHHNAYAEAQFRLALALADGNGVQADTGEAMRLFDLAAGHGHLEAQYQLANRLELDAQDPAILDRTIGLYRAAADSGHASSQYRMGVLLKSSEGLNFCLLADNAPEYIAIKPTAMSSNAAMFKPPHAPHFVQALSYFRQAAEQGNIDAQYELGHMLAQGLGAAQDFEQAAHWYLQSAQQGNTKAQFNLGFLYAHGQGVKEDYINACKWYAISARSGNAHAQKSLEIILRKMTPAQIERAEWHRDVFFNNLQ